MKLLNALKRREVDNLKNRTQQSEGKDLNAVVVLLSQLVAIELWNAGVSQKEIAKRLGVAKATANKYLRGLKRITS